jgi:hypothetical protein
MLARARNDDVDPERAEDARGEKSFVAHEVDVVPAGDAARGSGLGAVSVPDESDALALLGDGAREGECDGRLVGSSERRSADADHARASGQ